MSSILIKNGTIVDPANNLEETMDIYISQGQISMVEKQISKKADQVIDAIDQYVVPGLIDMHVHFRDPGYEYKEDIESGSKAGARGGFTTVACMPNTYPIADNQSVIEFIKHRAEKKSLINILPIGAITKGSKGEELSEIADLKRAGVIALSDDGNPVENAEVMRRAMEYAKMFGLTVISHAEDKSLAGEGVMHEGYYSTIYGLKGIPSAAEEVTVARDIILAELTGCPLHIAHVSTAGSVRIIREAKKRGVPVTCEVTPHHIALTDEIVGSYHTSVKVNPPLRTAADVEALKVGLQDGTIDIIATDHAPHSEEDKDLEFDYAPFGLIGLETSLGVVFKELVEPGFLSVSEVIKKMSFNPSEIFKLGKGNLSVGSAADLTIIDPNYLETVRKEDFLSKSKNSPFIGWELNCVSVATIVNGTVIMEDRKIKS